MAKFQVELAGQWKDYEKDEDKILKRAFLAGFPNAKFTLRGANYEYNFQQMVQKNLTSGKERKIRAPHKWKQPAKPIVPKGPTICVKVPPGGPGTTIQVDHPKVKGAKINVAVPRSAKVGQAMLVPVPDVAVGSAVSVTGGVFGGGAKGKGKGKGKSAGGQKPGAAAEPEKKGMSTGAKVAAGAAGAAVVGGAAFLGAHAATEGPEATGEMVSGAAEDAVEWTEGAAEDAVEWTEGAAEDVGDWAEDAGIADAAEDAAEWLGDAAEDVGDFIMDLF